MERLPAMPRAFKHLHRKIYAFDNLYRAFRRARQGGKRMKESVAAFELDLEANLWQLHEKLRSEDLRALGWRWCDRQALFNQGVGEWA